MRLNPHCNSKKDPPKVQFYILGKLSKWMCRIWFGLNSGVACSLAGACTSPSTQLSVVLCVWYLHHWKPICICQTIVQVQQAHQARGFTWFHFAGPKNVNHLIRLEWIETFFSHEELKQQAKSSDCCFPGSNATLTFKGRTSFIFSLHIRSMWETICDPRPSRKWQGKIFAQIGQNTLFWDLVQNTPPPKIEI